MISKGPLPAARFHEARRLLYARGRLAGVDPDAARTFLAALGDARFASLAYRSQGRRPLIQPRGGYGTFDRQRRLTIVLRDAGADFIPLTIDSHTRHNDYERAAIFLERSEQDDRDYLNGYPLVNHGHEVTRMLYTDIERPISLRHGTPDARDLVEVALASGITEIEGGALCYTLPYSRAFPLDRALLSWQYVDRLCAELSSPERPIHRESFGVLTATMVPPAVVIAVEVLEAMLAAEQGVTSFAVSFGQTGSFEQDVALARALRSLTRRYVRAATSAEVDLRLVYQQWMGAFPADRALADSLIASSALIARLIDVDKVVVKTRDEAFGLPTPEANAQAVRAVRYVFEISPRLAAVTSAQAEEELEIIEAEAEHLLDAILGLPYPTLWERIHAAVKRGILDIPFAPHQMNAGQMITLRGANAAIRISDPGGMPISSELLRRERALLRQRSDIAEPVHRQMLVDVRAIATAGSVP